MKFQRDFHEQGVSLPLHNKQGVNLSSLVFTGNRTAPAPRPGTLVWLPQLWKTVGGSLCSVGTPRGSQSCTPAPALGVWPTACVPHPTWQQAQDAPALSASPCSFCRFPPLPRIPLSAGQSIINDSALKSPPWAFSAENPLTPWLPVQCCHIMLCVPGVPGVHPSTDTPRSCCCLRRTRSFPPKQRQHRICL